MSKFEGFPSRGEYTSIPNVFFSRLLPEIEDLEELKVTLHVIAALYRKKGYPRFVSFSELLGDAAVMGSLKEEEDLRRALKMGLDRGTLINVTLADGAREDIFFLNDEAGRQAAAKIESGELKIAGSKAGHRPEIPAAEAPDIFTLYEQNIGLITPLIADDLREDEQLYPPEWIRDAIREAALHNKRNIRYIDKILENWSVEGRSDGAYQRDTQKTGPDRYFRGKYGHMVQR
jgi:DNA replication protein